MITKLTFFYRINRDYLSKYLTYSQKFQIFIVCLVILDCLIVIVELLFDLGAIGEQVLLLIRN